MITFFIYVLVCALVVYLILWLIRADLTLRRIVWIIFAVLVLLMFLKYGYA